MAKMKSKTKKLLGLAALGTAAYLIFFNQSADAAGAAAVANKIKLQVTGKAAVPTKVTTATKSAFKGR